MFSKVKKKTEKAQTDLTKERDERCVPAAEKVLAITAKGRVDKEDPSELFQDYRPLIREIMDVLKENKIKIAEVGYIFRLVRIAADMLEEGVNTTLDKHLSTAEESFWGKPGLEVTVEDLDDHIKAVEK